ncbi:MAG: hypothetical protein WCN85_15440, partial [Burkholderiales bacterium]
PMQAELDMSSGLAADAAIDEGVIDSQSPTDETGEAGEARRRSRRRRGGRGRDRGQSQNEGGTDGNDEAGSQALADDTGEQVPLSSQAASDALPVAAPAKSTLPIIASIAPVMSAEPSTIEPIVVAEPEVQAFAPIVAAEPPVETLAPIAMAVAVPAADPAPVPAAAPIPEPLVASIPEPVMAPQAPASQLEVAKAVAAVTAPLETAPVADTPSLMAVVEGAGLQWVQTAPSAVAEPEAVAPVARAIRVRKPRPMAAAEPLMQVETGQPPKAD